MDVYQDLRSRIRRAVAEDGHSEYAIEGIIIEALTDGGIFKSTGQTDPSPIEQLNAVYKKLPDADRSSFRRAVHHLADDACTDGVDSPLLVSYIDLAAAIGCVTVLKPLYEFLRRDMRPNEEKNRAFLDEIMPTMCSIARGNDSETVTCSSAAFFREILDVPEWRPYHDLALLSLCFMDPRSLSRYFNDYLVRVYSGCLDADLLIFSFLEVGLSDHIFHRFSEYSREVAELVYEMFLGEHTNFFAIHLAPEGSVYQTTEQGMLASGFYAKASEELTAQLQLTKRLFWIECDEGSPNFDILIGGSSNQAVRLRDIKGVISESTLTETTERDADHPQ